MDDKQFDCLARMVTTRRVSLALGAAALLGLTEAATGKKRKKRRCKKIRKGARCDGTTCDGFSVNTCHSKKFGRCRCREGTSCLSNKSCGLSCGPECPNDVCFCGAGDEQLCFQSSFLCEDAPTCSATAECPLGTACTETRFCPGKRCIPLCHPPT